jgi:hypothetical protein
MDESTNWMDAAYRESAMDYKEREVIRLFIIGKGIGFH